MTAWIRGGFGEEWIHAYKWLSPFTVHLKLPQHFSLALCTLSCFSRVRLFATLWTVAHQAPLSMGFSRQEYWSGFANSSSRGSSPPRDQSHICSTYCTEGGFFTAEPPGKFPVTVFVLKCILYVVSINTLTFSSFPFL